MNNLPSISVVMPTYQRIDQTIVSLHKIVDSEISDVVENLEIITSDGSPNDELKVAIHNTFGNRVIHTRSPINGIAANKNHGASIAKHPILIFCDSDIEIQADTIANSVQALKSYPNAAGITGDVIWKTGPDDGSLDRPRIEDRTIVVDGTSFIEVIYSRYFVTYKSVFESVGKYDIELFNMRGEGSDLSIRYWRAGYPLVYDKSIQVHHVYDTPEGVIRHVAHPEFNIAKDYAILAYKYGMLSEDYPNFAQTIQENFKQYEGLSHLKLIQGILFHMKYISDSIDVCKKRETANARYDFKFLEVFSNQRIFNECIQEANVLIASDYNFVFN